MSAAELYDSYAALVQRVLRRQLGSVALAEDGVQEVLFKVYRALPRVREPGKLRSYVVATTVRWGRSEMRKRRFRELVGIEPEHFSGPVVSAPAAGELRVEPVDFAARQATTRANALLRQLPWAEQTAFVLFHLEELGHEEIAAALGTSERTVRRRLASARHKLSTRAARDDALSVYVRERSGGQGVES